jgi:TolA-binding protein
VTRRSALLCALLLGAVLIGRDAATWASRLVSWSDGRDSERSRPIEVLLQEVDAAEQRSDAAAIERLCAVIVDVYPEHAVVEPAMLRLVQARLKLGDGRGALRALHDMRMRFPASKLLPEATLDVGAWQYRANAYADAAGTYTDLVALVTSGDGRAPVGEDTAPAPVIWRSKALWNEHKRAERSRTELERLARHNQALCYELGGDRESALRAYERFVSRFPQDAFVPEARFHMASLLESESRLDEALRAYRYVYEDALAPVSFRCESMYRAGRLHQAARRFDDAIAVYRQALPLEPTDNEFRLAALGELAGLLEGREPKAALAIYRELSASSAPAAVRAGALQRLAALGAAPAAPTTPSATATP